MGKIYPLNNDLVFKTILKKNKNVVKLFLKEFLNKDVNVKDIKNASTVIEAENMKGKTIISDVVFEIPDATVVFMEMQKDYSKYFKRRLELYIAKLIANYTNKGNTYDEVKTFYGIAFINTLLFTV